MLCITTIYKLDNGCKKHCYGYNFKPSRFLSTCNIDFERLAFSHNRFWCNKLALVFILSLSFATIKGEITFMLVTQITMEVQWRRTELTELDYQAKLGWGLRLSCYDFNAANLQNICQKLLITCRRNRMEMHCRRAPLGTMGWNSDF